MGMSIDISLFTTRQSALRIIKRNSLRICQVAFETFACIVRIESTRSVSER